ncbi:MAG: DUF4126 domain-containing protein [Anaerolineales bacterium]|nr:DUF4126 domain-containing protein [Anaerolineales bacterium]
MNIFSAFGLSFSAGLNAYIPLLLVALLARFTDLIKLSSPWDTLTNGWVIGILIVLSLIEFLVDKIPAVNHINDIVQSFIRPTAGAIVFASSAQVVTDIHPVLSITAGLLVAGGVHAVKSFAVRPAVTASTAGVGEVPVSLAEDVLATILSILAIVVPVLLTALIIILTSWVIWWMWRRSKRNQTKSLA